MGWKAEKKRKEKKRKKERLGNIFLDTGQRVLVTCCSELSG